MAMKVSSSVLKYLEKQKAANHDALIKEIEDCCDLVFNSWKKKIIPAFNSQIIADHCITLCLAGKWKDVYNAVMAKINEQAKEILASIHQQDFSAFFKRTLETWLAYNDSLKTIALVLQHLNESNPLKPPTNTTKNPPANGDKTTNETNDPTKYLIYMDAIKKFKETLNEKKSIITQGILDMISQERKREKTVESSTLSSFSEMLEGLGDELYQKIFEAPFLEMSRIYFKEQAEKAFEHHTTVNFITEGIRLMRKEIEFCRLCFLPSTRPLLVAVLKEEFFLNYKDKIVTKPLSGIKILLINRDKATLKRIFDMLTQYQLPEGGALGPTIKQLENHIIKEVNEMLEKMGENEKPEKVVQRVIEERNFYEDMLITSFSAKQGEKIVANIEFSKAVRIAFDKIVAEDQKHNFPEALSLLLDKRLSTVSSTGFGDSEATAVPSSNTTTPQSKAVATATSNLSTSDTTSLESQSIEDFFSGCILFLNHIRDKDKFEQYYNHHLAKRLLIKGIKSDDDEKRFLEKLKGAFGKVFTSKLEGMFQDIKLSIDLMGEYNSYLQQKGIESSAVLSVKALKSVNWPGFQNLEINDVVLSDLSPEIERFKNFYLGKYSGRKIQWQHSLGEADIRLNGFEKHYELSCSSTQMFILLLFNKDSKIRFQDIAKSLFRQEKDYSKLKTLLAPLLMSVDTSKNNKNGKILLIEKASSSTHSLSNSSSGSTISQSDEKESEKETGKEKQNGTSSSKSTISGKKSAKSTDGEKSDKGGQSVEKNDFIYANNEFFSSLTKNKVKEPTKKLDARQTKELDDTVSLERKFSIDACIVRIMKARKTLTHSELIAEVSQQLMSRFPINPQSDIKPRIEHLIETEFLERSENDRNIYNYLA